jgi:hypothetical protein
MLTRAKAGPDPEAQWRQRKAEATVSQRGAAPEEPNPFSGMMEWGDMDMDMDMGMEADPEVCLAVLVVVVPLADYGTQLRSCALVVMTRPFFFDLNPMP